MNQTIEPGTETAAPTDGEQPTETAADDTLELLESARADLAPGVFDRKPEEEGAEATASEGEIEPNPAPETEARKPLPLEVQQSIDKRIGKEVSKRKELEEKLENEKSVQRDLEEKLKAARTGKARKCESATPRWRRNSQPSCPTRDVAWFNARVSSAERWSSSRFWPTRTWRASRKPPGSTTRKPFSSSSRSIRRP